MTRKLVSLTQAADLLGVSVRTLRRRISAGELAGYRLGPRLIRVDLNEIETLIHQIPTAQQETR